MIFFNHPFISENDEDEDAKEEFESEIDSQNISIIKKVSQEKANKAIRDNQ